MKIIPDQKGLMFAYVSGRFLAYLYNREVWSKK